MGMRKGLEIRDVVFEMTQRKLERGSTRAMGMKEGHHKEMPGSRKKGRRTSKLTYPPRNFYASDVYLGEVT